MKKVIFLSWATLFAGSFVSAQNIKTQNVPVAVRYALSKKYPEATKVSWEKEKGNYEANWGGSSGEDNSAQFTSNGDFIEIVKAISVKDLPAVIAPYIKANYKGAKIREAGKITDAGGKTMYEAEIKGADLIFDQNGSFIKKD